MSERRRVVPHLNLQALTWPPKDNATVQRPSAHKVTFKVNLSLDEDSEAPLIRSQNGTSSSSIEFSILQRPWKPIVASEARQRMEEYEDDKLPVLRDRTSRRSAHKIDYNVDVGDSDSETLVQGPKDKESAEPPRPISSTKNLERKRGLVLLSSTFLDEPLPKKPRNRLPSPRRKITGSSGQHSGSAFARNSESRRGVQQPTPQSTRSSVYAEISESESDVVIVDDVPRRPKVKEEKVDIKKEPFPVEVCCLSHMVYLCMNFYYAPSLTGRNVLSFNHSEKMSVLLARINDDSLIGPKLMTNSSIGHAWYPPGRLCKQPTRHGASQDLSRLGLQYRAFVREARQSVRAPIQPL